MVITTKERQIKQYKAVAKKERKKGAKIVPIKPIIAVAVAALCSACSGASMGVYGSDYAQLSGSAEGIKEMFKGLNGMVTTGKSQPNTTDSYWINQDKETDVKRLKFPQPIKVGGI